MKKVVYSMLVASIALFSCGGEEKKDDKKKEGKKDEQKEEVAEKVSWSVDAAASTLEWNGYKGTDPANDAHIGMISITEGSIETEGANITSGSFKIDMNTMKETTEGADPTYSEKLIGHLGNEDFFNVIEFPSAEFVITGSMDNKVMGDLNVMGKTIAVEIPYEVSMEGDKANFTAEFPVDFSSLMMPGTQMEEGGDVNETVSASVNFTLRMTASK